MVEEGVDEGGAGFKSDGSEEDGDAELTEEEECGLGGVGDEFVFVAEGREEYGDDEGATGEAELDGLWDGREVERDGAEEDTEGDAEEDGDEVGFVETVECIAEGGGGFVDVGGVTDNGESITELKRERSHGDHVNAGAVDAGDVDVEEGAEVQVAEALAVEVRVRDNDTSGDELRCGAGHPVFIGHGYGLAEEGGEDVEVEFVGDKEDLVIKEEGGVTIDKELGRGLIKVKGIAEDTGDDEGGVREEGGDMGNGETGDGGVGDEEGEGGGCMGVFGFEVVNALGLVGKGDTEGELEGEDGEDDAGDTEWIGDGIAEGDVGVK
jgi:hypothetical protein